MQDFQNLIVWQRAHELTLAVYRATATLPPSERYGLTAQMRSAAVSVESNIAEGCGRGSDPDFARFLHNATGSANELECQILVARDLGYWNADTARGLSGKRREVKRMLAALIATVKS
jgi:four helix bundle protein